MRSPTPLPRAHRANCSHRAAGFTLVETVVVCTLVAVLAGLAWPAFRDYDHRAGRVDAVEALTRVQAAQERYRSAHGLYAGELAVLLGTAPRSPQGRYAITLALASPEAYVASANALGPQAQDSGCATLTLHVKLGFAQVGPHSNCWQR